MASLIMSIDEDSGTSRRPPMPVAKAAGKCSGRLELAEARGKPELVLESLAGEPGFEPRLTESESAVLPLNYSPAAPAGEAVSEAGFT